MEVIEDIQSKTSCSHQFFFCSCFSVFSCCFSMFCSRFSLIFSCLSVPLLCSCFSSLSSFSMLCSRFSMFCFRFSMFCWCFSFLFSCSSISFSCFWILFSYCCDVLYDRRVVFNEGSVAFFYVLSKSRMGFWLGNLVVHFAIWRAYHDLHAPFPLRDLINCDGESVRVALVIFSMYCTVTSTKRSTVFSLCVCRISLHLDVRPRCYFHEM